MGTGNTLFNVTEKIRVRTEGETSSLILILLRKLPTKEFSWGQIPSFVYYLHAGKQGHLA